MTLASSAFADLKQWTSRALPIALPCQEPMPDVRFELTRSYKKENAFLLLWAASLAESPDRNAILAGLRRWGFAEAHLIGKPERGAYAYLAEDPAFHLLSFRGTNSWQESLIDSFFLQSSLAPVHIAGFGHTGMMWHFKALLKETEALLNRIDPLHQKPLLITGHSLGGAMAQLHAVHFAKTGWDLIGLYTSAQPRVGDALFNEEVSTWLQDRYYRLEADQDMTPRVPPAAAVADVFAEIVPDQLKNVQDTLRAFVRGMNYDSPRGVKLGIGKTLRLEVDEGSAGDVQYWSELRGSITDGRTFPEVMASLKRRFTIHPPPEYMCAFLAAWRAE